MLLITSEALATLDEGRGDGGEGGATSLVTEELSEGPLDVLSEDSVDVIELDRDTDGSESDEPEETLDVADEDLVDDTELDCDFADWRF